MSTLNDLPFKIDIDNISAWLTGLSQLELTYASNELYKVVKIVNKQAIKSDDFYLIIDLLTPATLQFSQKLELLFIGKSTKHDRKTKKLARLSTNLLRYLALAYARIAQDDHLQHHQLLAISRAFEFAGLNMRHNAMLHERQSSALWEKMGTLYQIGFSKNLLDQPTDETEEALKKHTTITAAIKRNILFAICNPYNFSSIEINQLYSVIEQYCELLELKTLYKINNSRADFYWPYLELSMPLFMQPDEMTQTILHINTSRLINFFQSSKFRVPFAGFKKIIYRLSKYQEIIHSVVASEPIICNLATGFEHAIALLAKPVIPSGSLGNKYARPTIDESAFNNFKLEPFAGDKIVPNVEINEIWQNSNNSLGPQIVKVQRAIPNDFCIVEVTKLVTSINQPAILHIREKNILGIIRQIQNPVQLGNNTYQILIEKIVGVPSCLKSHSESIILITKNDQSLEVLLPLNKYTSGTKIKLLEGEIMLEKLLEESKYFMHFTITNC
jgi:hypothetical protein